MHCRRKRVGFPGAMGSCARRRKVLERGSAKVPEQGSGENVIFVSAGSSCVPALGRLFPRRRGKVAFIHYRRKMCKKCVSFPGAGGSCVPAAGKLFPGAGEGCVLAPGKLFPGAGERLAGRRLVCFDVDDSYIKKLKSFFPGAGDSCPLATGKACSRRRRKVSQAPAGLIRCGCLYQTTRRLSFPALMCPVLSGAGERSARRRPASLLDLFSTSNIRSTSEERCVGFTGAGECCARRRENCFPAPWTGHIHSVSKENV